METSSYYGSSVVLQRLVLLPALPYFRLSGLGGPQLYTPMLTCMYVCKTASKACFSHPTRGVRTSSIIQNSI